MSDSESLDTELERRFRRARFLMSTPDHHKLPEDQGREVAFAGRSNAGKSSAINAITDQNGLARTSKTPGRTQQLVVFSLGDSERLIDLPGYGYAKVPQDLKRDWHALIDNYVRERESLSGMVVVSDIRHALTDFDRQMLAYCRARQLRCVLLLSKSDKLNRGPAMETRRKVLREIEDMGVLTEAVLFSAHSKAGLAEARRALAALLDQPAEH
ncbi:MAG: YihA family ribosome biogenesis GTP-binding protein [Rhodanobacteraceae bacterium]|nr:YihA family ribosome biogenesis GTP-binding protein [Rhodanobacteraceae bacterium]